MFASTSFRQSGDPASAGPMTLRPGLTTGLPLSRIFTLPRLKKIAPLEVRRHVSHCKPMSVPLDVKLGEIEIVGKFLSPQNPRENEPKQLLSGSAGPRAPEKSSPPEAEVLKLPFWAGSHRAAEFKCFPRLRFGLVFVCPIQARRASEGSPVDRLSTLCAFASSRLGAFA